MTKVQPEKNKRIFEYCINAKNIIVSVSSDWLSFARENKATRLCDEVVIGKPLFHFLAGEETRHLYELIIERVRLTQRKTIIPFRCDSPTVRRFMELAISPLQDGQVQFTGRIIRKEEREIVPLLDETVDRSEEYVVICSWCKRVEVSGEWLEVESAVIRLKLFNETVLPKLTHGICADCLRRTMRELDRLVK